MAVTVDPPVPAVGRRSPRWASAMIGLGLLLSMLVAPAVFPGGAEAAHRPSAACTYWVAGWVQETRPCSSAGQLPAKVKQCLFALAGGVLIADAIGAPLAPAVAGALLGCGGSLIT